MMKFVRNYLTRETLLELFRFFIAGMSGLIVQFALYALLMRVLTFQSGYLVASAIAFVVSVTVNYIICVKWVFTVKNQTGAKMALFALTSVIGLAINTGVLYLLVDKLSLHKMLAQAVAAGVVMFWNYVTKRLVLRGQ